jgi:hypothetical protein
MILLELKESVPNPAGVQLVRWDSHATAGTGRS